MLNVCLAGHKTHDSKLVESDYGPFWIWDWEQYMDFPNYCSGQDEVSKSIDVNGYWEKPDTDQMLQILQEQPGLMLDFGSHIGWFATQAAALGCDVWAVDADPENMRLMDANLHLRGVGLLGSWNGWVADKPVLPAEVDHGVRYLKADVEGHEFEVIDLTRALWQDRLIDYANIEISPIFENRESIMAPSYAELVDELRGYGYEASVHKDEGRWVVTGADCTFDQENLLFAKLP